MSSQTGTLTIIEGPSAGQEYALTESELTIGRQEGVELVIDATVVSRRHARIVRRGGQYYVEDLNSSNGTFLNGKPVKQVTLLAPGDEIGLGQSVTLRFSAPEAAPDRTVVEGTAYAEPESGPQQAPAQKTEKIPPHLLVQMAGRPAKSHALEKDVITVGRAEDNDVVIDSRIVSRYHARLERSDGGYRLLVSPQASNPVLHEGQPLDDPRHLRHNDELRIGQDDSPFQVTLTYEAPDAAPEATVIGAPDAPAQQESLRTMRADDLDLDLPEPATTPEFSVQIAGEAPRSYALEQQRITIGRAEDNDIILSSRIVSRHHAYLERSDGGYRLVPLPDITNPVLFEGRPLEEPRRLRHEDKLRIGGLDPGSMVTMTYVSPEEAVDVSDAQQIDFGEKMSLSIGRDASNDIVVDTPTVSRYHAQIERVGQRYRVTDLRSSNGTFVNDQRIEDDVWLQPDDTVRIGPYRFVMGQDALAQYDESSGLRVEAVGLNKWVRKDLNILQDISLLFQPREFIVIVGQSGGGKSTLIDSIAGYRPATHGSVHVNDIDVYKNFDAIRNDIGYVPQRDIIHMELTIFQALDYAAQLRMPADTTKEERHRRIDEVLRDLDLAHRKDTQISQLSGGQQKRVSIGVELLTKPGLFFLDEPTSGLDPGTETSLMQLMRRLADQGRTIALITHATKNVMLADKVVFLARGGHLVWYGPPDEALRYFDKYRSERDRRARDIEFDEIYALLDDPNKGSPEAWAERFREHPAYQKYIAQPLREADRAPKNGQREAAAAEAPAVATRSRHISSLRQFMILSARNIKILTRDRFSLALMLAAAPLVGLLQVILAAVLGNDPFDFTNGDFPVVLIILFLPSVYAVMVGGIAQMREIVKEQDVYKRERLVNLKIFPYVMSKIWVAALLSLYQTACYVIIHNLAFEMPGGLIEYALLYVSLVLATMAGMMLGLFASALAPNANAAPLIVILFMVPQIVLGGALVPLPSTVNAPISTRWSFQAWMAISGAGSDVARDACWDLPPEQRAESSLEFRNENCNCMGVNALRQESCNFPGVGQFYNPVIDEPPPSPPGEPPPALTDEDIEAQLGEPPDEPGEEPAEPELPPQPERPEDESDQIAMADYFDALEEWQTEVDQIRADYRAELDAYRARVDQYQEDLAEYQQDVADLQAANIEAQSEHARREAEYQAALASWNGTREGVAQLAEAMIRQFERDFGWTFVNKQNTEAYRSTLYRTWLAQSLIIGVLFVGILIMQKRKDVV